MGRFLPYYSDFFFEGLAIFWQHLSGAALSLLCFGQCDDRLALNAATASEFYSASGTLDEEEVTLQVGAVSIVITGTITLIALREHIVRNPLPEALVEDEVLAPEFRWQSLALDLVLVVDNPAMELVDILKPMVLQV